MMSILIASPLAHEAFNSLLESRYGLSGTLERLDGEFDLNFALDTDCGRKLIVKVMRAGCDVALVDMQCGAMRRVREHYPDALIPQLISSTQGDDYVTMIEESGDERIVWLMTCLPGTVYASRRPRPAMLVAEIGRSMAEFNNALASFRHPFLERDIKWDLRKPGWISDHLAIIEGSRRPLIEGIMRRFSDIESVLFGLPEFTLHNDVNDYNIMVETLPDGEAVLRGLIDFGDMLFGPVVCELAIAGAYLVLDEQRPFDVLARLVAGYHRTRRLTPTELDLIYPLLLTRLAVSVVNAAIMKRERPDDPYVSVTEIPAWRFLERFAATSPTWVAAHLKNSCGLPISSSADATLNWIERHQESFGPVLKGRTARGRYLDLSVGSNVPSDPLRSEAPELGASVEAGSIGRYAEPRLIYTGPAFRPGENALGANRTVHLGIDLFASAGDAVSAPFEGIVHAAAYRPTPFDYGGVVVLRHRTGDGANFFTLYGHLSADAATLPLGTVIEAGGQIGRLGTTSENGGWAPHLHFQLGLLDFGPEADWPGAADPDEAATWLKIFPNPSSLLRLDKGSADGSPPSVDELYAKRSRYFGGNLKLSYRTPIAVARGWKHFLYDSAGRAYLDAYNNVPHVGHGHPRIAAVVARQTSILSTNTRYLHPALLEYAEALTSKFPDPLKVCYFVNSASEGNELALRLARAATGARDTIVMEQGYHGNTNAAIDISAYKFDGPGGTGAPDWVHVVPQADPYRGPFKRDNPEAGARYAAFVEERIEDIHRKGRRLAAFICESLPSVGGQIVFPDNYLSEVYKAVRAAGGCCIADEVQTGLGRLGKYFWGFETQGVVPDIVVLGKPLGNGYPIGAVVTTRSIADAFNNGMEFFSTFGGNTVSAMVGHEVLRIIDEEGLAENAETVGNYLRDQLMELKRLHPSIGDVRGCGLFLGVELVTDHQSLEPATMAARHVVNRLREERVFAGLEGRFDNIIKIRPPLTFDRLSSDYILQKMDSIFSEDIIQQIDGLSS